MGQPTTQDLDGSRFHASLPTRFHKRDRHGRRSGEPPTRGPDAFPMTVSSLLTHRAALWVGVFELHGYLVGQRGRAAPSGELSLRARRPAPYGEVSAVLDVHELWVPGPDPDGLRVGGRGLPPARGLVERAARGRSARGCRAARRGPRQAARAADPPPPLRVSERGSRAGSGPARARAVGAGDRGARLPALSRLARRRRLSGQSGQPALRSLRYAGCLPHGSPGRRRARHEPRRRLQAHQTGPAPGDPSQRAWPARLSRGARRLPAQTAAG